MTEQDRWTSARVREIALSAIKDVAMRSARVPGAASLAWGLPSFRTPAHIRAAAVRALQEDPDIGKYALPDGLPAFRKAAARFHEAHTGVAADPDANFLVSAGNMEGLKVLFQTIIEPGDEIVLTDPCFASHIQQITLCGGKPVYWKLDEAQGWRLDIDGFGRLITPRTKAVVIVSPSNPTGTIFSEADLRQLGDVAQARGILVIVDDPYAHFTYENKDKYFPLSAVPELAGSVAYLHTFSKCHAMSGWRLAYMVLPEALKRQVLKVHDATMICTPRISQVAGIAALEGDQPHLQEFESELGRRRELICDRLDRVPHVFSYVRPEGAYYVFPRIEVPHEDSVRFSISLLEEAKVAVTPGGAFGPSGENHVRMAFCVSDDTINEAFDRIEKRYGAG